MSESAVVATGVRTEPLDVAALAAFVAADGAGAVVTFTGVVRDHDRGRAVTGIEYVGHPEADSVLAGLAKEFIGRDGVHAIAIEHRLGTLVVGDLAVVAAVSASHRAAAFSACAELIDTMKQTLPIWKRQLFRDGTAEWSNCP